MRNILRFVHVFLQVSLPSLSDWFLINFCLVRTAIPFLSIYNKSNLINQYNHVKTCSVKDYTRKMCTFLILITTWFDEELIFAENDEFEVYNFQNGLSIENLENSTGQERNVTFAQWKRQYVTVSTWSNSSVEERLYIKSTLSSIMK